MESGSHGLSLADENGETFAFGEDLNFGSGPNDAWGSNEDGFERIAGQFCFESEDGRVALGSICIAFNRDVEDA